MVDSVKRSPVPSVSVQPEAFTEYVFSIHADAYLNAGLAHVPARDLLSIGFTPNFKDTLSWNGLKQAGDVALRLPLFKLSAAADSTGISSFVARFRR